MEYRYIEPQKIEKLFFSDQKYIVEFCEAAISSINEFITNYSMHLMNRNMEKLREAGHKIKPGAEMMGANKIVDEYYSAKQLLYDEAEEIKLSDSVDRMKNICDKVKKELSELGNIS